MSKRASLVMTRSTVQFCLAAPAFPPPLLGFTGFSDGEARGRYVQLDAERFRNVQPETGNRRAICSADVPESRPANPLIKSLRAHPENTAVIPTVRAPFPSQPDWGLRRESEWKRS